MNQNAAEWGLRIVYLDGPGDVAGTYAQWKAGQGDPNQMARTYSGQFFDVCRELGAQAYVLATCGKKAYVRDGDITIEHRPINGWTRHGLLFHLGQAVFAARLLMTAVRFRADVVLVSESVHWFMLLPLKVMGFKVAPLLHCTLWPRGYPPTGRLKRWINRLNGWFWRHGADATLTISRECARQITALAGVPRGPIFLSQPSFSRGTLEALPPPPGLEAGPFRVLYAGRVEKQKGVFDLLAVAEQLHRRRPGAFAWDVCGEGGALEALHEAVRAAGMEEVVRVHGHLNRQQLMGCLGQAHVMIAPTTHEFAEGFAKTVVEAVLAGRPVVATTPVPAVEDFPQNVVEVPPGDVGAIVAAVERLRDDDARYARLSTRDLRRLEAYFDDTLSWAAGLTRVIAALTGGAVPEEYDLARVRPMEDAPTAELGLAKTPS